MTPKAPESLQNGRDNGRGAATAAGAAAPPPGGAGPRAGGPGAPWAGARAPPPGGRAGPAAVSPCHRVIGSGIAALGAGDSGVHIAQVVAVNGVLQYCAAQSAVVGEGL